MTAEAKSGAPWTPDSSSYRHFQIDTGRVRTEFHDALAHERGAMRKLVLDRSHVNLLRWEDANQVTRAAARELWQRMEAARIRVSPPAGTVGR